MFESLRGAAGWAAREGQPSGRGYGELVPCRVGCAHTTTTTAVGTARPPAPPLFHTHAEHHHHK